MFSWAPCFALGSRVPLSLLFQAREIRARCDTLLVRRLCLCFLLLLLLSSGLCCLLCFAALLARATGRTLYTTSFCLLGVVDK